MNEDNDIGAKAGEVWLTAAGRKAIIYATDGGGEAPILGAMVLNSGRKVAWQWSASGRPTRGLDGAALVSRHDWRTELAPIWAVLNPQYRWLARDSDWRWWGYPRKPITGTCDRWTTGAGPTAVLLSHLVFPVPPCPWYETLTERPD